jgi:hypothetical protein
MVDLTAALFQSLRHVNLRWSWRQIYLETIAIASMTGWGRFPVPTARATHHFLIEIGIVSIKLSWPRSRRGSSRLFIPRRALRCSIALTVSAAAQHRFFHPTEYRHRLFLAPEVKRYRLTKERT